MSREEGEGVITADILFGSIADEPETIPDRYWIAEFPEAIYRRWEDALKTGHQYYLSATLPYVKGLLIVQRQRGAGRRPIIVALLAEIGIVLVVASAES
jgi:hypothetical protein